MKKKKLSAKLSLNKINVSELSNAESYEVKGGTGSSFTACIKCWSYSACTVGAC